MNLEEWEGQNPIFKWRVRKGISQQTVATKTDSSASLIRLYEKGRVFPGSIKVGSLAALMERDAAGLEHALRKWLLSKPQGVAT